MTETLLANEPLIRIVFFPRRSDRHGHLGSGRPAPAAGYSPRHPLDQQHRRGAPRQFPRPADLSDRGGGAGASAAERGWGLFNVFEVPAWLAIVVSVAALDLAIYLQHVMFHAVPALWRLHRMHHADLGIRRDHGPALPPGGNSLVDGDQAGRWSPFSARPAVAVLIFEVLPERHGHVQPFQREAAHRRRPDPAAPAS